MDVLHLDAVHLLFLLPESPESQVMNGSISCRSVDRSSDGMGFLSIPLSSGKYVRGSWDCSFLPPSFRSPSPSWKRPGNTWWRGGESV